MAVGAAYASDGCYTAGGIEEQVVQRIESRHVEIAEGKVTHHGQHQQSAQVAAEVVRMVVTLSHEEYHHRSRQPSDAVQTYLHGCLCLLVGLYAHPGQMVCRHGNDGDDLQRIAAQSFCHHPIPAVSLDAARREAGPSARGRTCRG